MNRHWVVTAAALAMAGCGGRDESGSEMRETAQDTTTFSIAEAPPPAVASASSNANASADSASVAGPPRIGPSAAPGVAFNYRYAFRLPAERVSSVQEGHAQACERLGLARCRITGMRYRLVDERSIEAMLAFKLDPALARAFGKQGIEAVTRAEGMLVDSEITGEDVGTSIKAATRSIAQLQEDLARIEAQLARAGRNDRSELTYQAQQLRNQIRANRASRETNQESLATTPMVFQYGSGDLVPGFETRAPFRRALTEAGDMIIGGASTILLILAALLPWALVGVALAWLARRFWPRLRRLVGPAPEAV